MRLRLITLLCAAASFAVAQSPDELEAVVNTDMGTFRFEFAADKAPKHVEQFIKRARAGYYNGSAFFRVVANGLIQGGDPLLKEPKTPKKLWGTGGLNLMPGEYSDMKHERGVVSTVRIPEKPDSDGSQFFIVIYPQPQLDGKFSAFGLVNEGMDVVEKISRLPAGESNFTEKPVRIISITIGKKKVQPFLNATPDELHRTVTLKTTVGTIKIKLEPDWAPNHVRNFLMLTSTGWFDGTAFHRLVKGFVVQGGMGDQRSSGPTHLADRWVHTLKGEFQPDVKHTRGVVSMARTSDPDSADTSFFLMLGDAPHLDAKYSAFGRIIEGLDVLDAFEKEEVDGETPKRRIEIIEATVDPV
jgi:peptidyl-prolyl cis-trans isomerase B (cyclophilin B)